jgi:hypothetical protein
MSLARLARGVAVTLAVSVLAVSGLYVIVDLARWEWNRAMMSGLVFVAALVVTVAMVVLRYLRRLEERLGGLLDDTVGSHAVRATLREGDATRAARHFDWLGAPPDRLEVFVPVLLGAGVIVSFITFVIEHLAGAVARRTVDRTTVRSLAVDLPLGAGLRRPVTAPPARRAPRRASRPTSVIAVGVAIVVLVVVTILALRDLTQTRLDDLTRAGSSTIVIGVEQRRTADPAVDIVAGLWSACRSRLPGGIGVTAVVPTGVDEAALTIDRALGRSGRLRIVGCIEDHTLDLVRADVRSVDPREVDAR